MRNQVLPATLGRVGGISYAVAGDTADSYDDTTALHSATPVVVTFVVALAFLLLLAAFRSAAIPLVSIAAIVDTKTLGVGLAAAVLIDATVVRGILLPAAMSLLGERCWYLPRWLSWLPGRRHE